MSWIWGYDKELWNYYASPSIKNHQPRYKDWWNLADIVKNLKDLLDGISSNYYIIIVKGEIH